MKQASTAIAALCALALCRCAWAADVEVPLYEVVTTSTTMSDETLELATQTAQQPQRFVTAVTSAPRNDSGASLGITLAGLYGGGVHDVHIAWGRFEESGRPPAHVSAVLRHFLGRVHLHMMPRELWRWYFPGARRHINANYYLALRSASHAEPDVPVLVLEDDIQIASSFALRLISWITAIEARAEGQPWALSIMGMPSDLVPPEYEPFMPGVVAYAKGNATLKEGFYGAQGMLYSAGYVREIEEWFYHHTVGTPGHRGEEDKPQDYTIKHFMQERPDGLFLLLEEALVEHLPGVSAMNGVHWEGMRFVDQHFVRVNGQPQPSAHTAQ